MNYEEFIDSETKEEKIDVRNKEEIKDEKLVIELKEKLLKGESIGKDYSYEVIGSNDYKGDITFLKTISYHLLFIKKN